jgi:hypothetical protein
MAVRFAMAWALALPLAAAWPNAAQAQESACGSLYFIYGPFDYRTEKHRLPVVENRHFTPRIEALIGGGTSRFAGGDIEYTLRAFPNHARALAAVMRLGLREGSMQSKGLRLSVDCHFERALRFRSDDVVVRMLFAQWLGKSKRRDEALKQLGMVKPEGNTLTLFNLGLLYAELAEHGLALQKAHELLALGQDPGNLRAVLEKAGHWRTPPATPEPAASTPGPSASASAPA